MGQRIDVNHLNIYYGNFLAVEDVNLNIEANKVTAFIGPSGCGKSTVLRTLDRMHEIIPGAHCEGEVLLEGKNLYAKDVDPVASSTTVRSRSPMRTIWSNGRCVARTCGMRSRIVWIIRASACPAVSSRGCASLAPWPCTRRCCSWMSRAPRLIRFRPWPSRI